MGRWIGGTLAAVVLAASSASALTANLITDPSLVNHLPGADLRVGTTDDGTASGAVGVNGSGPNTHGAASFALLDGDGSIAGSPETQGYDYLLFVDGTLQFMPDYTASTADGLAIQVTGGSLRTTAEFGHPGRGEAMTAITGGTAQMNPMTGAGSVQLTGTFSPSTASAFALTNETLTAAPGAAKIVLRSQFNADPTGYVATVLVPLVPANATAIVLAEFTGTVASPGCCTGFVTRGVLAAYTIDDLGCADVFPQLCGAGGGCSDIASCRTGLASVLPTPVNPPSAKARKVALKLQALYRKAGKALDKAATVTGKKQEKQYKKAKAVLAKLLAKARAADAAGTLGVALAPLEAALNALLARIP